ncbi:nuclear transport factor 2 family protein [Saccharothrix sp. NPDC042600]|uniref:nuclear transport factor 2 family protein n=1 Tax=Saccharothrix TaxID=2071 RepID=UPI0033CB6B5B|nr:hypothetical protein GCM10017745_56250 [Saccharothrix mutabilis subsp. capreolus]
MGSRNKRIAVVVAAVVAVGLVGGGVALVVSDHLRAVVSDAVTPLPSGTATELDPAARRYVDAVAAGDLDGLVDSFAPEAVIVDVGREIRGHDAIRHWADTEVIGGRLTVLESTARPGGVTMLVRFEPGGTGGFRARYSFDVRDGVIVKADLQYA